MAKAKEVAAPPDPNATMTTEQSVAATRERLAAHNDLLRQAAGVGAATGGTSAAAPANSASTGGTG